MKSTFSRSNCLISAAALSALAGVAGAQVRGPSSSQNPYVLPVAPGVTTTSIFTVGDTVGGYRMVGIPDGLGGFNNGDGTFTLMMNHELGPASGAVRAHGQTGSFVSRWNITADGNNLLVNSGRDHNTASSDAYEWNGTAYTNAPSPAQQWGRFCSGDLAAVSAYSFGALGTTNRIYLNGEEVGNEGRAYAHIATGSDMNTTWQLPALGRFSWENALASPFAQQQTIVIGNDDSTPGQVSVYVGNKTAAGTDIERAGLTNGTLYGVRVAGNPAEDRATGITAGASFDLVSNGDATNRTGASLRADNNAAGVTNWNRPEDGAWDPRAGHQNDYYFVTTDRVNTPSQVGRSRLWRMRFNDITNPTAGGTVEALINGTEGGQMFDNICIDPHGRILLTEDLGSNSLLGKVWLYDINSGGLGVIAQHDSTRFLTGAPNFLTQDEEASGIIDASGLLGDGWFLMDTQAHYGITGELVEGGQLMAMYVDPSIIPAPGAAGLLALAGIGCLRRRRA